MQFSVVGDWFRQKYSNQILKVTSWWIRRCFHVIRASYELFRDVVKTIRDRALNNLALLPGILLVSAGFSTPVLAGQNVTVGWNRVFNANIIGYRVYYGTASRAYSKMIDAGKATGVTITNLAGGVTYYFATTAYNILGLESVPSPEISYTPPLSLQLQISIVTGTNVILDGTGMVGHTYEIQATTNLVAWTVIGTAITGSDGSFQFTNSDPGNFSRRFYRSHDTQP